MSKLRKLLAFIFYSFLLFIVYVMMIFPSTGYDYIVGAIISSAIMFISLKTAGNISLRYFSLRNIIWILAYLPYLFYKIIQANLDVALRVLNPKLPINPGFIKVNCDSKDNLVKLMLANSITLTPGTLSCEIKEDYLIVHTIDESAYKDREKVKSNFMHYLKEIEE